jgi:hypothetical protein
MEVCKKEKVGWRRGDKKERCKRSIAQCFEKGKHDFPLK